MAWSTLRDLFGRRHADQWAYKAAAEEIQSGHIRDGLMLKAAAHAAGDAARTKAVYLKFLAEQIVEDAVKGKFKQQAENMAEQAKLLAAKAYDDGKKISLPAASAARKWSDAFARNLATGLVLSLVVAWYLTYLGGSDGRSGLLGFVGANLFSGYVWGTVLGRAIPIALVIVPTLAVLMCFEFMRRESGFAWLILLIPIGLTTFGLWKNQQALVAYQTSAYDRALRAYERQIPQINPDSPHFDKALTDQVAARMQEYKRAGHTTERSLELAVFAVFSPPAASSTASTTGQRSVLPSSPEPSENCQRIYWQTVNAAPQDMPLGQYVELERQAKDQLSRCR